MLMTMMNYYYDCKLYFKNMLSWYQMTATCVTMR